MKAIYKYAIRSGQAIKMPQGVVICTVDMRGVSCQVWAIVNTEAPLEDRTFFILATGQSIPEGAAYVGTYFAGPFVWHVFEQL